MAEPRRRFRFLKELAQGGFGKVYLAEMITGDNFSVVVAIKLLHGKWITNDEVVMRSRDEARLLGRLRHRNIVRVEDLTSIQGQCCIVMEYLQGVDLKTACTWLKDNDRIFPRQSCFEVASAIGAALDAAYNAIPLQGGKKLEVIHRDIKPSNALITIEGDVKVLDFGTARASFDDREAKTQALAFGSAAYMAPERLMGEEDTPAADVFSLGVTLYELLTLESFGKIHIRPEKFEKAIDERVAALDLSQLPEGMRAECHEAIRLMLAYEPTQRPSAHDVMELMEAFAEQARDGGLKRFSRDTIKLIIDAHQPEQDPNDPYMGTMIHEDTSTFQDVRTEAEAPEEAWGSGSGEPAKSTSGGSPRTVSGARPVSGARSMSGAIPRSVSGPVTPNPVSAPIPAPVSAPVPAFTMNPAGPADLEPVGDPPSEDSPFQVPEDLQDPIVSAPRAQVAAPQVSAPRPASPRVESQSSAPRAIPFATPGASDDAYSDPPPKSGGGLGKIIVVLGVLGMLGLVVVGGAVVMLGSSSTGATDGKTADPFVEAPGPKLKGGAADMDFTPNGTGKGGVILKVPEGATEVTVTSPTGFREEWDGSQNLRLKDLDPGPLRSKIKPKGGGPSLLADFSVEGDTTCVYTFTSKGGGAWEKSECR